MSPAYLFAGGGRNALLKTRVTFRKYMRDLELQEREAERQRKLKTAAEVKDERQQKWLAMTEEEKVVFLKEEKSAKTQEWVKKQVRSDQIRSAQAICSINQAWEG